MPSTVAADHPELRRASVAATGELEDFHTRVDRYDGVDHEQHRVYLGRAERLVGHLRGALLLSKSELYASAFAVLRVALEHQLQDRLLHLGRRFARTTKIPDDAAWQEIQAGYASQKAPWARTLAQPPVRNEKGVVTFVYRGIADAAADPATTTDLLHPLYFEMDRYFPTVGRPADQANFDDGLMPVEHLERRARENRDRWHQWLSWSALRRNLELNGMFTGRNLVAIDVHYAFLSGFTHATNAAYDAAFDRWGSLSERGTSHFAEELVYLYVTTLAASELRLVTSMEDRAPPVRIMGRAEVEGLATEAEAAAAHLWFPGGRPHEYDRVTELNRRHWRAHRAGEGPPTTDVSDDDIPYYGDPLRRLRAMHRSYNELTTGLVYQSPWPNPPGNVA